MFVLVLQLITLACAHADVAPAHPTTPGVVMKHMNEGKQCTLCHAPQSYHELVMLDGTAVLRAESFKLCGQCHGEKLAEWSRGDHGKLTGYWLASRGEKKKLNCTECHNPHTPKFESVVPQPAPRHPKHLVLKKEEEHK